MSCYSYISETFLYQMDRNNLNLNSFILFHFSYIIFYFFQLKTKKEASHDIQRLGIAFKYSIYRLQCKLNVDYMLLHQKKVEIRKYWWIIQRETNTLRLSCQIIVFFVCIVMLLCKVFLELKFTFIPFTEMAKVERRPLLSDNSSSQNNNTTFHERNIHTGKRESERNHFLSFRLSNFEILFYFRNIPHNGVRINLKKYTLLLYFVQIVSGKFKGKVSYKSIFFSNKNERIWMWYTSLVKRNDSHKSLCNNNHLVWQALGEEDEEKTLGNRKIIIQKNTKIIMRKL